jgi:hypothetical protein
MVVAVDLMRRGYEVFRALSPACSCDLIALGTGLIPLRIEVRTGRRSSVTGTVSYPRIRLDRAAYDHLGVVVGGNEIIYLPSLPEGYGPRRSQPQSKRSDPRLTPEHITDPVRPSLSALETV